MKILSGIFFLFFLVGCQEQQQTINTPNVILILTDDQRYDTLHAMPTVTRLAEEGTTFTQAFVTTPVCTPTRASILSGGKYGHKTGVLNNPHHRKFKDENTIATALQNKGYKTGFIGKYIHGYKPGYVPPGWTSFVTNSNGGMIKDWFNLRDITIGKSSKNPSRGKIIKNTEQYITYFQRDHALEFIDNFSDSPFFLFVNTNAPHVPRIPAPEDDNKFDNIFFHTQTADAIDLSDKPMWVKQTSELKLFEYRLGKSKIDETNLKYQDYLETLVAVDRMINSIINKIEDLGIMNNTIIIFTSDNGVMMGEHGLFDKGIAYEESIQVPLVIKIPGASPSISKELVAMNLDVPATIFDIANITYDSDGLSLVPLLNGSSDKWRNDILLECGGYLRWWRRKFGIDFDGLGFWSAVRTKNWKYIAHPTGEEELYHLSTDPHEEENLANNSSYINEKIRLSQRLEELRNN